MIGHIFDDIVTLFTAVGVILTAYVSLRNGRKLNRQEKKISAVHKEVNGQTKRREEASAEKDRQLEHARFVVRELRKGRYVDEEDLP